MKTIALVGLLILLPAVAHAADAGPETPAPVRVAAAFWLDSKGAATEGVSYDLLALQSPRRPAMYWRVSLVLGGQSGGVALTSDLWQQDTRFGSTTVSLGGVALAGEVGSSQWTPGLIVLLRVGGSGDDE